MIAIIENFVQMIACGIGAGIALYCATVSRGREWLMLALFYCELFLGDLFWQFYQIYYQTTPQYSYISEPAWYSAYLFLFLLLMEIREEEQKSTHYRLPWLSLFFTGGMCLFFMQIGDYLSNIAAMILMTLLLWNAVHGLLFLRNQANGGTEKRFLYFSVIAFCLIEYILWTSSMIWEESTIRNPYYWFDLTMSFIMLLFIPALRKAKPL